MKLLAALLLLLLAVPAAASVFPYHTFAESLPDVVSAGQGACHGEAVLVAKIVHDGTEYAYFAAENGRFVFAEMQDGAPVMIYVGQQLPGPDRDTIKIVDAHPFSAGRDGDGPCGHLFPANA